MIRACNGFDGAKDRRRYATEPGSTPGTSRRPDSDRRHRASGTRLTGGMPVHASECSKDWRLGLQSRVGRFDSCRACDCPEKRDVGTPSRAATVKRGGDEVPGNR